jgi:anti-sigma-K factor RskA
MTKIGIDEETHVLICDYVEGNLDAKNKRKIEKLAVRSKSIRDLIADTQYTRNILVMYASNMTS